MTRYNEFWLINPNEHNPNVEVGKRYRIPFNYTYEDEPSPYRGLEVTVISFGAYTEAGYDCVIEVHALSDELKVRFEVVHGRTYTIDDISDWHSITDYGTGLYIEFDTKILEKLQD
jgi:hypothetical protein